MLYDLNVVWNPSTTAESLDLTLRQAALLGYDAVALNHTISKLPIPSPITNPLPLLPASPTRSRPTTLRRATVVMSDPRDNHRLDAVAAAFDLLAVRPTTEASFNHACTALTEQSIISLDLSLPLGFYFRPRTVMAAVKRGIRLEVCYAQGVTAARDQRSRALFVANLVSLLRATKGRGLVVSSGAAAGQPAHLRAPADVVNLLAVWGLGTERGLDALSGNPRGVVVNEGLKRSAFRGVVDIVQAAGGQQAKKDIAGQASGKGAGNKSAAGKGEGSGGGGGGKARNQQKKQQPQQPQKQQGTKRKNGEQDGAGGEPDTEPQQLSKRRLKKQRRAAAQEAQAGPADAGS